MFGVLGDISSSRASNGPPSTGIMLQLRASSAFSEAPRARPFAVDKVDLVRMHLALPMRLGAVRRHPPLFAPDVDGGAVEAGVI